MFTAVMEKKDALLSFSLSTFLGGLSGYFAILLYSECCQDMLGFSYALGSLMFFSFIQPILVYCTHIEVDSVGSWQFRCHLGCDKMGYTDRTL